MSEDVTRHYSTLLAEHYTWMLGAPFAVNVAEQLALLQHLGVGSGARRLAVDLGCGSGFQSVALSQLDFQRVLAVDTSAALLAELKAHAKDRAIDPIEADIAELSQLVGPGEADAIVCMGDTLTHLSSRADVACLFRDAHQALAPDGLFILTFRDLSVTMTGLDRFIPVRADEERIMTCFLEYEPESVVVHDLIHVREDKAWCLRKSSYRKLRLAPEHVSAQLRETGFRIRYSEPYGRLWVIAAAKQA
jgi:SAM-dependent methyltransferase